MSNDAYRRERYLWICFIIHCAYPYTPVTATRGLSAVARYLSPLLSYSLVNCNKGAVIPMTLLTTPRVDTRLIVLILD